MMIRSSLELHDDGVVRACITPAPCRWRRRRLHDLRDLIEREREREVRERGER